MIDEIKELFNDIKGLTLNPMKKEQNHSAWEPIKKEPIPFVWEDIFYKDGKEKNSVNIQTSRAKVPGGCMVQSSILCSKSISTSMVFFADEKHEWKIT